MKKSKLKIFSALMICFAFVGILLFSSNNKIYASEIDDYNYNLIDFAGDKTSGPNSIKYNKDTYDYTYTHNHNDGQWGVITLNTHYFKKGDIVYLKSFTYAQCIITLEIYIDGQRYIYENGDSIIDSSFIIEYSGTYNINIGCNPWKDNFTIENFTPYVGFYDIDKYQPNLNYISDNSYNNGYNEGSQEGYNNGYDKGYNEGLLENATSVLYKAFNGATANLIYDNKVIISEAIYLTENDLYFSINNISDIKTYLNDDESSRYYSLSISLNSAINNELVVSLNNDILDTTLTLFNSLGGYRESFSRAESSLYTIIANSQGKYYDTIVYDSLYAPDYIDFKLNLDLSQLSFEEGYNAGLDAGIYEGYNKGSQEGYNNGYDKGYNKGKIEGYNKGYNEGATSNIETNSIKTLFNSILSYPVNLVSNVLDFEFMGINVASLIMFIVSIGIVVFVVKKFW